MSEHVTERQAKLFVAGTLPRREARRVVAHLMGGCGRCRRRLRPGVLAVTGAAQGPFEVVGRYDEALDRGLARAKAAAARLAAERAAMVPLLEAARAHPEGIEGLPQETLAAAGGLELVDAYLAGSHAARYRDPHTMLRLAWLARIAAEHLDPTDYGAAAVADAQARAWAELGNAWRVTDKLDQAEKALDTAGERLALGTRDPHLRARVADLRASLLADSRRFPKAVELLGRVERLYRRVGDLHLAGRAVVSRGIYTNYAGQPTEGVKLLREGLALIDRERDPQLVVSTTESMLWIMAELGQFRDAGRLLLESNLRQALAGEPLNLLKLRWLEGKIQAGLERLKSAERAFEEARAGFVAKNLGYNAALVALDLAGVWLRQGRTQAVRGLAEEVVETFARLKVPREAERAAHYVLAACEQQRLTLAALAQVARFLARLEREPGLRFERP